MKFQCGLEHLAEEFEFLGGGNGPSLPPGMHLPRPVSDPSSHQPHPGSMWQSWHDFIPKHWRPSNAREGIV